MLTVRGYKPAISCRERLIQLLICRQRDVHFQHQNGCPGECSLGRVSQLQAASAARPKLIPINFYDLVGWSPKNVVSSPNPESKTLQARVLSGSFILLTGSGLARVAADVVSVFPLVQTVQKFSQHGWPILTP